jgi:hypothetical protein
MPTPRFYDARLQSGFAEGQVVGNRDPRPGQFTSFRAKKAGRFDLRVGIGASPTTDAALNIATGASTTGASQAGVRVRSTASSSATTEFDQYSAEGATQAAAFTVPAVRGLRVKNVTKGAGSTITAQMGVDVDDLTSGASNYGYRGRVSSGAGKYNLYLDGTAINYMAGNLLLGTTTDTMTAGGSLAVAQDFAHRGGKVGFYNTTPITKPAITGNRNGNAAIASAVAQLVALGLATDSTTNTAPAVTGSRGGNAALASLLSALAGLGIITDSTTA